MSKRRFVLIIAVSEYRDQCMPRLPGVRRDAECLRTTLETYGDGGVYRICWLADGNATKGAIVDGLREIAREAAATDQVIVYFGGHGARHWGAGPERWNYCLLPHDATFTSALPRGLSTTELGQALNAIHAQDLVVIFDCCHSGGIADLSWTQHNLAEALEGWRNHYVLAAARGREEAGEDDWGGFFMKALCAALQGEGVTPDEEGRISVQAAWARAADVTRMEAARHGHGQVPVSSSLPAGPIYVTRRPPPTRQEAAPDWARTQADLAEKIIHRQRAAGHWDDSVSTTSAAIVALSEYARTPGSVLAVPKAIDWLRRTQGANGAWGRFRHRTKEEKASGETPFDPDWPHTVYAVWAQLHVGAASSSCVEGLRWLCDRYQSERDALRFSPELDLMTLGRMADQLPLPDYPGRLSWPPPPAWRELEARVCLRQTFSISELKSLYRYVKCARRGLGDEIANPRAVATHLEVTCHPWQPLQHHPKGLNLQATVLRLLLQLAPEEYVPRAQEKVMSMLPIAHPKATDFELITLFDTVGFLSSLRGGPMT